MSVPQLAQGLFGGTSQAVTKYRTHSRHTLTVNRRFPFRRCRRKAKVVRQPVRKAKDGEEPKTEPLTYYVGQL
jgi:hypothetical protein